MAHITTSGDIVVESGALEKYTSSSILVGGTYNPIDQTWSTTAYIVDASTRIIVSREVNYRFTKTAIDLITGTGTGDTAKIQNALEQAVKTTLFAINGAITFTIV